MLRLVNESQNRFPREKLSLALWTAYRIYIFYLDHVLAFWNRHVKLRPLMFAAPVAGGRTEINA